MATSETIASARDERRWNRMADMMTRFHDYFKQEFNVVYELADGSFSARGMSLRMYLSLADELRKHLTMHHTIEERHIFPNLAKRMPSFKADEQHIAAHHAIHEGLDQLGALLDKWRAEPAAYAPQEMRACLDGWRGVLFRHLDEEVQDLSGENMRKYWSMEEFDRLMLTF